MVKVPKWKMEAARTALAWPSFTPATRSSSPPTPPEAVVAAGPRGRELAVRALGTRWSIVRTAVVYGVVATAATLPGLVVIAVAAVASAGPTDAMAVHVRAARDIGSLIVAGQLPAAVHEQELAAKESHADSARFECRRGIGRHLQSDGREQALTGLRPRLDCRRPGGHREGDQHAEDAA